MLKECEKIEKTTQNPNNVWKEYEKIEKATQKPQ